MKQIVWMFIAAGGLAIAQTRTAEWVTSGADAQRSRWIPGDPRISVESMVGGFEQAGLPHTNFEFLWKSKPGGDAALSETILMDRYIGYRGFRSFAFVVSKDNMLFALDSDLDRIEWKKQFGAARGCVGAVPSIARSISLSFPASGNAGRVAWAHSDVGDANQGAVTLPAALRAAAAALAPPPPSASAATPRPGPRPSLIYMVTSDGALRSINVSNGDEMAPAIPFIPPQMKSHGLTVVDNVAYVVAHDCADEHGSVWAVDLTTQRVARWDPRQGAIAGSSLAFTPDGTIYVATKSGKLVGLSEKSLAVKETYDAGSPLESSPLVFAYKGRTLVAAATRDGGLHVIDAASPATAAVKIKSTASGPVSQASWQSMNETRWLVASSPSGISALKFAEKDGSLSVEQAWSHEIKDPLPPMIVNGVAFVLSRSPAILHAIDAATGKHLWDSGKTIPGIAGAGGLSGGASQIYLSTQDGTIYAFGFPLEH